MRTLIVALLLASLAACGGDSTSPPSTSISGTYRLQTINDSPLPFTVSQEGNDKFELLDDQVTLTDGGMYTETGHLRTTEKGVIATESVTDAGTFIRAGTSITFHSTVDNSDASATINGTAIIVSTPSGLAVYTKL